MSLKRTVLITIVSLLPFISLAQMSSSLLPTVYTNLEVAIENPEKVYYLDLSHQGLTEFPKELLQMKNLLVLDLSGNYISDLPKDLSKIQNLEELYLSYNLFPVFPQALFQLNNLKILEMSGNGTPVLDFMEGVTSTGVQSLIITD